MEKRRRSPQLKTKSAAEQRAANALKPKVAKGDENLPDNVKELLRGNRDTLEGLKIVVTGVPPKIG